MQPTGMEPEAFLGETEIAHAVGTLRTRSPEATMAAIRPSLQDWGVTRVAMVQDLDRSPVAVAQAIRPNATTIATSQGKGLSVALARCSAVMEAIELAHAERLSGPDCWARVSDWGAIWRRLHPSRSHAHNNPDH